MSEEILARYCFLPWLRRGIARHVDVSDDLGGGGTVRPHRASVEIQVDVNDVEAAARTVGLYGPGDVTAIASGGSVRTDPRDRVTDFEPNYLPLIEFRDADFPWRHTPAKATGEDRLRPWIALLVLADDEFEDYLGTEGQAIRVLSPALTLPDPSEIWAWAHVHVNCDMKSEDEETDLTALIEADASVAVSRLVCPRKLKANTAYHAFVIPAFETGRLAGLGMDIPEETDGFAAAWGEGQEVFPAYHSWQFRTGDRGDFEYLVRLLRPRTLDPRVGTRDMDLQSPGLGVTGITDPPALGLEGALRAVGTESTAWPDPARFQAELSVLLNLPDALRAGDLSADPVVTPPIYGQWHALVTRVGDEDNPAWIETLNLDPRLRTPAGFGTGVVQKTQESLMASAWRQIGDVLAVNRRLLHAQLAREVGNGLHRRRFAPLAPENLVQITSPVHTRILSSPTTIRARMRASRLPLALVNAAFRRITRPRGPLARRLHAKAGALGPELLARVNAGEIAAAPPKPAPSGALLLDETAEQFTQGGPTGPASGGATGRVYGWLESLLFILGLLFIFVSWPLGLVFISAAVVLYFLGPRRPRVAAPSTGAGTGGGDETDVDGIVRRVFIPNKTLSPEAIVAVPAQPDFLITKPGTPMPPATPTGDGAGADSIEAANFRLAAGELQARFQLDPEDAPEAPAFDFTHVQDRLLSGLDPNLTVPARTLRTLHIPGRGSDENNNGDDPIIPVTAYPDFPQPMYEPLRDISAELLVPNLSLIRQNTIALLETNRPFIEAYMVGLNHEMARELLWREYPTDQRGSYFRQFWDVRDYVSTDETMTQEELAESLRDIEKIHEWSSSNDLGENSVEAGDDAPRLVLVIRGDLLKKYPNAVISAVNAVWPDDAGKTRRALGENEKFPLYSARVDPDITFLGFDLSSEQVTGSSEREDGKPGWFFVIAERPGEPRFGLDSADGAATATAATWDDLSWGHLAVDDAAFDALDFIRLSQGLNRVNIASDENPDGVEWNADAAQQAHILYQVPVRIAIHASEMLP